MKKLGCIATSILLVFLLCICLMINILTALAADAINHPIETAWKAIVSIFDPTTSDSSSHSVSPSARSVVRNAVNIATHLRCSSDNSSSGYCPSRYVWYGSDFPQAAKNWIAANKYGADTYTSGDFQCVSLVVLAYALSTTPLPYTALDGDMFWKEYANGTHSGWVEKPNGDLPRPGDIMAWSGGSAGHVSIVVSTTPTSITFAQANSTLQIETLPLLADHTVDTRSWGGLYVQGYIRPADKTPDTIVPSSDNLPKSKYVEMARQDAIEAGIDPNMFLRQINQESGFNPNSRSDAGAVGIAQFLPSTAAELSVDPSNPEEALKGAARLMASHIANNNGNLGKALAAYNAGQGTVDKTVAAHGSDWLAYMPSETQNYVQVILNHN